jgi:ribosomal protein L15E
MLLGLILALFTSPVHGYEIRKFVDTYYKTFEVVAVDKDTMTLKADYRDQEITVTIDRRRRPYLEVGDKVRYDNIRNRLGANVLE